MACEVKLRLVVLFISLLLILLRGEPAAVELKLSEGRNRKEDESGRQPPVPCYFIFGDSLVDNGNNNLLLTTARVNYPPYGIDFPYGPTGRFTNGRTTVDVIAELLGFDDFIPSFLSAQGSNILKGVNYASGAGGILKESGRHLGARINMNMQLQNHQITVSRIIDLLGSADSAMNYLNKCLYSVGIGNNDFIDNYFLPQFYPTSSVYNVDQFAQLLISEYSQQLQTLYNYGARKITLFGVQLIGCSINAIAVYGATEGSDCVDNLNIAAENFNKRLKSHVDQLSRNLPDSQFIYVNLTGITSSLNASSLGFRVRNSPCCQVLDHQTCVPYSIPCENRREYVYWDGYHPTEALNEIIGQRSYNAFDPSDAYPFDIRHLVQL